MRVAAQRAPACLADGYRSFLCSAFVAARFYRRCLSRALLNVTPNGELSRLNSSLASVRAFGLEWSEGR